MLRSCYSVNMRFFRDDPTQTLVHWYHCRDNVIDLPFPTVFTSRNWEEDPGANGDGLGEVYDSPRVWRDGSQVGNAQGTNFCGTEEMFSNGVDLPPVPPVPINDVGTPICCNRPSGPILSDLCGNCPTLSWSQYTIRIPAVGGPAPCFNTAGDWTVFREFGNPCQWQSVNIPLGMGTDAIMSITLHRDLVDAWVVAITVVGTGIFAALFYSNLASPDCIHNTTLNYVPFSSIPGPCTWPATLEVRMPI